MDEILKKISNKAKKGISLGLKNISLLCAELGNIQNTLKFVHVAGTNGKGSVCAFCESVLCTASLKTGCYTSPGVFEKLEQFRINGNNCSLKTFKQAATIVLDAVGNLNAKGFFPSEFEIETAIAFEIFYIEKCDICIIECGMGGLLDATNIIKNTLISVLTPIEYDHAAFLGNNIEQIAGNKCGIIKDNSIVISASQTDKVKNVIMDFCGCHNAEAVFVDKNDIFSVNLKQRYMSFKYKSSEYASQLIGLHQAENAAACIEICNALRKYGFDISENDIKKGILDAKNPGRFEILCQNPLVICDGAHNRHGAAALEKSLEAFFPDIQFTIVMGVFKDKDFEDILKTISHIGDKLIAVSPKNERALDSALLAEYAEKYFNVVNVCSIDSAAKLVAKSDNAFCICGSLSYLSDFKTSFYKYKKFKESKMDKEKIEAGVKLILEGIGEDCSREGLVETPQRVARMYEEIFAGYNDSPQMHLSKTFTAENNAMVIEKDITFYSCCEHHILPFFGKAHIAYIPDGKVVGISKLARCVEVFAKRLQIQEQMTAQIADAIMCELSPKGVMVAIEAEHTCMTMRGVKKPGSKTFSYCCKGEFETNSELRSQFFSIIK